MIRPIKVLNKRMIVRLAVEADKQTCPVAFLNPLLAELYSLNLVDKTWLP
jgi:hypothetical protein